jgi:dTDP-4-amino-4,6-dideoxy-D-galactose acyltransferase
MVIKKLDWDSAFFLKNIFAVYFANNETLNLAEVEDRLTLLKADVVYCFVPEDDITSHKLLIAKCAILVDKKVTFSKELTSGANGDFDGVYSYKGELNAELISLSIEAGQYSRFKLDQKLNRHFEKLYTEWIDKSLKREIADEVFVYREREKIKGMLTCKSSEGIGVIGLVATEESIRGKGVGRKLVEAAESYLITKGVMISHVVTQQANEVARQFYQSLGYRELQQEYVFHWWLKASE